MSRSVAILLCLLLPLSSALARPRAKATPPPVHETVISSIAGDTVTISEDGHPRTFSISASTEIFANGKRATAAELKAGMRISVTLSDPVNARRIEAWNTQ